MLIATHAWVPAYMLSMPDRSSGMQAVQGEPLLPLSTARLYKLPKACVQVHMTPMDAEVIKLTMASADDNIIDHDLLPDDNVGGFQARSHLLPDTSLIMRMQAAHDAARVRRQRGARLDAAVVVIGQLVKVDDVVVG